MTGCPCHWDSWRKDVVGVTCEQTHRNKELTLVLPPGPHPRWLGKQKNKRVTIATASRACPTSSMFHGSWSTAGSVRKVLGWYCGLMEVLPGSPASLTPYSTRRCPTPGPTNGPNFLLAHLILRVALGQALISCEENLAREAYILCRYFISFLVFLSPRYR